MSSADLICPFYWFSGQIQRVDAFFVFSSFTLVEKLVSPFKLETKITIGNFSERKILI